MTHDELLAKLLYEENDEANLGGWSRVAWPALRAVVELHKPFPLTWKGKILGTGEPYEYTKYYCSCAHWTSQPYPCPTIQAIAKELE